MFDIFIKRSKVVLDCFTDNYSVFSLTPICKSSKTIPEWWKNIPKNQKRENPFVDYIPSPTLRTCPGFVDFYKRSISLPLWSDVIIKTTPEGFSYQFPNTIFAISDHPPYQHNFNIDLIHIKLMSPWYFKCKENIQFLLVSPTWNYINDSHFTENWHPLPGVVSYDIQQSTHVNIFLSRKNNRFELKQGDPLIYFFPLTEKEVIIKNHFVESIENIAYGTCTSFFNIIPNRRKMTEKFK